MEEVIEYSFTQWNRGYSIAPQGSFQHILLYSLKTVLFSRARVGSASEK